MTDYKCTYIAAVVHRAGDNPIINECSTTVTICDEAAGAFVSLTDSEGANIKFDPDELEIVYNLARGMLESFDDGMQKKKNAVEEAGVTPCTAADDRWHKAARDLLAVIHRDGGHHIGKVGFIQACEDAISIVRELRSDDERSKSNEWTAEKPTNGGVYWVQLDRGMDPATVEIYKLDDDAWRMQCVGTSTGILASAIESCNVSSLHGALWNGPILAPPLP